MKKDEIKEGDIGFSQLPNKEYRPFKILKIGVCPDNSETWHVLSYETLDYEPTEADVKNFKVFGWHSPIASFEKEAKILTNSPVTKDELKGYFEYLRRTDFPRYVQESGVDINQLIAEAREYYNKGVQLHHEKKYKEAIVAYTDAIDIFPLYYEALDNRGIAKLMDPGNYKDAISDFQESLEIEPKGFIAQFSLGRCYAELGKYKKAKLEIEKALIIRDDPMAREYLEKLQVLT